MVHTLVICDKNSIQGWGWDQVGAKFCKLLKLCILIQTRLL